jgi:hypothetical protein
MDRDANVLGCVLHQEASAPAPDRGRGGALDPALATRTTWASFFLPIERSAAGHLTGQQVTCTGLDWHGHLVP